MVQENTSYTGPILDVESEQVHLYPEPCVAPYGGVTSYPPPYNIHTMLPPPGNRTRFDPRHLPENHGQLPYRITQYNGEHCNTFMMPPPSAGVFAVPINQGLHDHLPFSNNYQAFERNRIPFMDGFNGAFKRKNLRYLYPAPGPSSSLAIPMDATYFGVPEYRGNNDTPLGTEGGVHRSARNRADGAIGFDPVVAHNNSHLVHGGQPVLGVPTPWLDQHGATGSFSWNRAPGAPYSQGCINGGGMEAASIGLHGYQVAIINRNSAAFVHPPITPHQGSHTLYHPPPPPLPPMLPVRGQNIEIHSQQASTAHRLSTNSTPNPFQNGIELGPRFVGPMPLTGPRVCHTHRRELMIELTARHHSFPHLRVLPEDELLALGEHIGSVGSGLSDVFILNHLKTRIFVSSRSNLDDQLPADQELNFCVICQTDFDYQEKIGMLDCRHDYHANCIKKWLIVKNTCPICKSTALSTHGAMKGLEKP